MRLMKAIAFLSIWTAIGNLFETLNLAAVTADFVEDPGTVPILDPSIYEKDVFEGLGGNQPPP